MLCVSLKKYSRACGGVTGGISDIGIFDPNDLNFTQGADVDGSKVAYSAIAERDGVDTPSVFLISFQTDEAEWTFSQSKSGCATKYEHEFVFQLPENSQTLTTFQQALDAAGCCCGIGIIFRMNSGKIFVAGEKYVNASSIPRFTMAQDGSDGGSGKLFDDFNGGNIHLKGSYSRNLYEFSGAWSVIEALALESGS
jgi:hypothetical protein